MSGVLGNFVNSASENSATIGILAGMGPRATAPFVDLMIDKCQEIYGAKFDLDFPHLLIYSLPTPFYVDHEIDRQAVTETISRGLKKLESWGVSFVAMPCNSAHAYFADLVSQVSIPVLNMVSETASALRHSSPGTHRRIAILAAEMTIESGVYQRALEEAGADVIDNSLWQKQVNQLILSIKDFGAPDELQKSWKELNVTLARQNIETTVLACTDLNALDLTRDLAAPLIDAGACLAEAAVRRWRSLEFPQSSSA